MKPYKKGSPRALCCEHAFWHCASVNHVTAWQAQLILPQHMVASKERHRQRQGAAQVLAASCSTVRRRAAGATAGAAPVGLDFAFSN